MNKTKTPENIIEMVDNFNQKKYTKKPYIFNGKEHTYGQLYDHILRYTGLFSEKGLQKGDKVLISSKLDVAFIEAHISLLRNGLVSVPVDPDTKQSRVKKHMEFLQPKGIIADKDLIESWGIPEDFVVLQIEVKEEKGLLFNKLLGRKQEAGKDLSYPSVLDSFPAKDPPGEIDPESDAYILSTSGTTAEPRGVRMSHAAFFAHTRTLVNQFQFTEDSRILNVQPLYTTGGLSQGLMAVFAVNAIIFKHLEFSFQTIEKFLDSIYTYKITHAHVVPTIISLLNNYAKDYSDAFQTPHFKVLTCSGSLLYPETWRQFEDQFKVRISNFYGLSETVTGGIFCGPDDETYKFGTIGKPVDCQVKIVNDGTPAGKNEIGEIMMSGKHIMKGYFNNPDLNVQVLKDGWFYTGDLGKCDDDGFYYIEGRKKLMIITGGINVMNAEVEEVLMSIEGIKDAVALGEEDPTWGEVVVAAVVMDTGKNLSEKDIIEACRIKLEQVKVPRKVYFLEKIPRTKSGKAINSSIRELIAELVSEHASQLSGDLEERLINIAAESFRLDPTSLSLETDNRDIDEWDSLSHLVLVSNLEREFNVRFATVEIMKIESLRDALNIIREK